MLFIVMFLYIILCDAAIIQVVVLRAVVKFKLQSYSLTSCKLIRTFKLVNQSGAFMVQSGLKLS